MKEIIREAVERRMPDKESIRINAMTENKKAMPKKAYAVLAVAIMIAVCTCIAVPMMINEPEMPPVPIETTPNADNTPNYDGHHNAIGSGAPFCYIHHWSYHIFLPEYADETEFRAWVDSLVPNNDYDEKTECPRTDASIVDFIERFGITDEQLIEAYKADYFNLHWDMKSLVESDYEAFEEHSKKIAASDEYEINVEGRLREEWGIKVNIINRIGELEDERSRTYYNTITDNGKYLPVTELTILDLVENSALTRKDLSDIIPQKPWKNGNNIVYSYVYNLDLLFEDRAIYKAEIEKLDVPYYESEVKAIDALLHIETRLSVTEEQKAVKTEDGVYIPEAKLPLSVEENETLQEKFVVYDGNIYWLTEYIYTNDEEKTAMVDKHTGEARRDFLRQRYSWEIFSYNGFSSNIAGDIYTLKDTDSSLRIALVPYDGCPYILIFESNRGMTVKNGGDILDLEGYTNVFIPYGKPLSKKAEKYLPKFTKSLYDAEFVIAEVDTDTAVPLKFEFADGRTTTIYLYEGGYAAYEHHLGYNVYLKISERMYNLIKT